MLDFQRLIAATAIVLLPGAAHAFTAPGVVTSPSSRIASESSTPVKLNGFVGAPGLKITIQAVNQNTGSLVTLGTAVSSNTGTAYTTSSQQHYKIYPWSFDAGVLAAKYWAPQTIVPDLATGQGHLEIFASAEHHDFGTFSEAAYKSMLTSGEDPGTAFVKYSDGKSTVLFDQDGVGNGPGSSWNTVQGMISNSHSPYYSAVAWSVGYYTVQGKKIYGLICAPTTGGPYPVVIYNHGGTDRGDIDLGGTDKGNGGGITGVVTAAGWTTQPPASPDGLGQCLDWAKRGWIFASSSYRGESIYIQSSSPEFATPAAPWTSDGGVELCSGEVTDVLALTDLLMHHTSSITIGSPNEKVPLNSNGKLFMFGYSHGGCITHRAVEQGAPVHAFSVIEGFTDFKLTYLNVFNNAAPVHNIDVAGFGSGAGKPSAGNFSNGFYYPDANGVMGYNFRSAHYFASRGDLNIQKFKTMPILIFQGDIDIAVVNGVNVLNPVFLDEPTELAADIGATNIFVGPGGSVSAPTSQSCIAGTVGAPFANPAQPPSASCAVTFTTMDTADPCLSPSPLGLFGLCKYLPIPLSPSQQHYFVVYHNMNHVNGGLAIKETFNRFTETNFSRQPGCDGLQINCDSD